MHVAGLFPSKRESDATQTMDTCSHTWPSTNLRFHITHRATPRRMENARARKQQGIEYMRRIGNSRQPFQSADGKRENQVSLDSTGARSATDGPFRTLPRASKREPWHGQSHVV